MSNMKHISNKDNSLQMMRDMWKRDVDDMLMSPLAVNTDDMIVVTMPPLEFRYFDALPEKINLQNNGLTVTLNGLWAADRQPCIAGANLDDKYNFSHLHFHWTDVDGDVINEHIVNGRGHKLEMHLIFFKGSCQTIYEAESTKNGFITLAYLFNEVIENQHFGIDQITKHLSNVRTSGQTAGIPVFPLSILVHDQPGEYFTYCGKIDKRGCKCGITQWIVFTKPCDVNREQVDQFSCMLNKLGHAIKQNYRKANPVPPGNKTRPYLVVLDVHGSSSTDLDVHGSSSTDLDVHGSSSTDLDVHGSSSTDLDVYGSSSTDLEVHGSSSTHLDVHGSSSTHLDVHGSSTTDLNVHGSSTTDLDVHDSSSTDLDVLGSSSMDLEVRGSSTTDLDVHGSSTTNLDVHGSSTTDLDVHGSSPTKLDVHGSSTTDLDVLGSSSMDLEVRGSSTTDLDVHGSSTTNLDVHGSSTTDLDVHGSSPTKLDVHGSSTTDLNVVPVEVVVVARSRSSELRETSRRRSLAVIASAEGGNSIRTLCAKDTKTQLLRRTFNLKKFSIHNHSPPTAKTIAIRNSRQSERVQTADAETESHLRPTLSFNATRPSWK